MLIREGYRLFREHGYQGGSIDSLMKRLEIPKGSFYYYFKNKEDFAREVLQYYINNVSRKISKTLNDPLIAPKQRIVKLYSDFIDNYTNKGGSIYGNFASSMLLELSERNEEIKQLVNDFYESIREMHVSCLNQAKRNGEIDRSADIEKITKLMIYSWEGAILRMKTIGNIRSLFVYRELLRD